MLCINNEKGKLIGLISLSGSGKTTILRMIAGLEQPDKGDIMIGGARVNDLPAGRRGIVKAIYFRGSNMQIDVEVKGQILKGWRSLEKKPLQEGDEARVLIHRIYSFAHGKTQIVENQEKQKNFVII